MAEKKTVKTFKVILKSGASFTLQAEDCAINMGFTGELQSYEFKNVKGGEIPLYMSPLDIAAIIQVVDTEKAGEKAWS